MSSYGVYHGAAPDERVSAVANCMSHILESETENRQPTCFCHLLIVSKPTSGPVKAC